MSSLNRYILILPLTLLALFLLSKTKDSIYFGLDGIFERKSLSGTILKELEAPMLYLYIEGLDKESLKHAKKLEDSLKEKSFVDKIYFDTAELEGNDAKIVYIREIAEPNIKQMLESYKRSIQEGAYYEPLDSFDPLGIVEVDSIGTIRNQDGYITMGDRGFLLLAVLKENADMQSLTEFIEQNSEKTTVIFSPLEYHYYNAKLTKQEMTFILTLGLVALFTIYFFVLKNIKLLFIHFFTQFIIFSISSYLCVAFFGSVHIFTVVLGMSVSSIGIDYLLHNFFGGNYVEKRLNKEVLFGFITTFLGFVTLFLMIDIYILKQMAFYSAIAIALNYLVYGVLFLGSNLKERYEGSSFYLGYLSPSFVVVLMLLFALVAGVGLKQGFSVTSLNIPIKKVDEKRDFFEEATQDRGYYYLADSFETLLDRCLYLRERVEGFRSFCSSCIRSDVEIEEVARRLGRTKDALQGALKETGFNEEFFEGAYDVDRAMFAPLCDVSLVKRVEDTYYADAKANYKGAKAYKEILHSPLDIAQIDIDKNVSNIALSIIISLSVILLVLFVLTRGRRTVAFIYLLFPLLTTLLAISLFSDGINVAHLFALVITLAISIDFSLYASNPSRESKRSIFYASLTTIFGFGILLFSSVPTLYSIGVTVSSAMVAVLFINTFMRDGTDRLC